MKQVPFLEPADESVITAGDLRKAGVPLARHIPDCASIALRHVVFKLADGGTYELGDKIVVPLTVEFLAPLRWVEMEDN